MLRRIGVGWVRFFTDARNWEAGLSGQGCPDDDG